MSTQAPILPMGGSPDPEPEAYATHHNGTRPYKFEMAEMDGTTCVIVFDSQGAIIGVFKYERAFIGKSPRCELTERSGTWGSDYDGNSALFHLRRDEYLFVGANVVRYTLPRVVEFSSIVRQNDIPQPYAVTEDDHHVLFTERVILTKDIGDVHPYNWYYTHNTIATLGHDDPSRTVPFRNINCFSVEVYRSELSYDPFPSKRFDELTSPSFWSDYDDGQTRYFMTLAQNFEAKTLSKDDYVEIIEAFGREQGFRPLTGNIVSTSLS